jgi:hypothetical protein
MPTNPVCANTQLPQQPPPQAPSKSPTTEANRAYYKEIEQMAGVLSPSATNEMRLQALFSESYVGLLNARLQAPGKNGGLDQLLAEKLGWKRWLWQRENATTAAGGVRQALLERSNRAQDLIRTYTQFEALPAIRELQAASDELLVPLVGKAKAQELLHDHVVVGQLLNLRNVSDSELVANAVYQRYTKHYDTLAQLDPSLNVTEALDKVAARLMQTTDDLAQVARNAGVKIESLENGGYFPSLLTPEFENYLRSSNSSWLSGFGKLKEGFQKTRLSNLPAVVDLDKLTALLQNKLLNKPFPDKAWTDYSAKELELLEQSVAKAQEAAVTKRSELGLEAIEKAGVLESYFIKKRKQALTKAKVSLEAKAKTKLEQYKKQPNTGNSAVALEKQKLAAEVERKLQEVEVQWQERLDKRLEKHFSSSAERTEVEVAKVFESQSAEVQKALDFQKAKLTLADISTNPGGLSKFLHESFSPKELQTLFDNGLLAQLPATSDELLEFYRTVDVGVRGLADAIVLDPVQAMKGYTEELAKAAKDHSLFKTAFDEGAAAGWTVDVPPVGKENQYVRVGESSTLSRYLQDGELPAASADLYIHKQVASALDSLIQINTNAGALASVSNAFQMWLKPFRRMLLLGSGSSYITRVFAQNVIATYSATGSLAQLPLAMVDTLRLLNNGFAGLPNTRPSFVVGGKSYNAKELFQAMLSARGGHALAAMQEPADLLEGSLKLFSKESSERARHFNELYTKRFGEPLTGKLESALNVGGDLFNASYRTLAFANQFLDLTFRWAVVRELASDPLWRSKGFEELMRHTDEYFSINADAGSVGNFVGSFVSPFAQFALNAPGSALRHALRHPWRTGNIITLYTSAQGSSQLSESELPEWLKENESYYAVIAKDPATGKHFVVMPQSVDYLLDSYTWFSRLGRDLAGINSTVGEAVESGSNPYYRLQKHTADLLKKTYWWDIVTGISNVNPDTLEKYELGAEADTLLGVPTTKGVRALLTSFVPLLKTLESSLPASVVGQAPTSKLVANDTLRVVDNPGVPSLFGAVPSSGGAKRDKGLPSQAAAFQTLTGLTITDIDPARNIIGSYKDLDTRLRELKGNRSALYTRLAQSGRAPTAQESARYQQLKDLELVLLYNKAAIDQHAIEIGKTPPYVFQRMQGKLDQLLSKPLKNDTMQEFLREYSKP